MCVASFCNVFIMLTSTAGVSLCIEVTRHRISGASNSDMRFANIAMTCTNTMNNDDVQSSIGCIDAAECDIDCV